MFYSLSSKQYFLLRKKQVHSDFLNFAKHTSWISSFCIHNLSVFNHLISQRCQILLSLHNTLCRRAKMSGINLSVYLKKLPITCLYLPPKKMLWYFPGGWFSGYYSALPLQKAQFQSLAGEDQHAARCSQKKGVGGKLLCFFYRICVKSVDYFRES